MKRKILFLWAAAAALMPTPASAGVEGEVQQIIKAYADGEREVAAKALYELLERRVRSKSGPDPEIERLYVEIDFNLGRKGFWQNAFYEDLLKADADKPEKLTKTTFLYAKTLESSGMLGEAKRRYAEAIALMASDNPYRGQALLGQARVLLADQPNLAARRIEDLIRSGGDRRLLWEAQLQLGRALLLAGDLKGARRAMTEAWNLSLSADDPTAVARTANSLAAVAAKERNRKELMRLLALMQRAESPSEATGLWQLPRCGTNGLRPDDYALIDVFQAGDKAVGLNLVDASRAGIGALFLERLAKVSDWGTFRDRAELLMVRCISEPYQGFDGEFEWGKELSSWNAAHGSYPIDVDGLPGDSVEIMTSWLRLIEEQSGSESPQLVLPLLTLVSFTNGNNPFVASEYGARMLRIAEKAGASTNMLSYLRIGLLKLRIEAGAVTYEEVAPVLEGQLKNALAKPGTEATELLYSLLTLMNPQLPVKDVTRLKYVQVVSARLRSSSAVSNPMWEMLMALEARLLKAVKGPDAAQRLLKSMGYPERPCQLADQPKHRLRHQITTEDYPEDAVKLRIQGRTMIEMSLNAEGSPQQGRVVYANPAFVFDDVSLSELKTIGYEPAQFGGKAQACMPMIDSVVWQLPE